MRTRDLTRASPGACRRAPRQCHAALTSTDTTNLDRRNMTTTTAPDSIARQPELLGQTVILIGGSAGIGLETARRARADGAAVILTGRDPERLRHAALEVNARSTAAFDATDPAALARFFDAVPGRIDHVLITGPGPSYQPLLEMTAEEVRDALADHVVLGLDVARNAAPKMRPGGTCC